MFNMRAINIFRNQFTSRCQHANCSEMFKHIRWCSQFAFVPKHRPPEDWAIQHLQEFIDSHKRLLVLTGAGISTESGIPDYRSEGVGLYSTSSYINRKDFVSSSRARQRYWARNYIGWPRFSSFNPSFTHKTIAEWERRGKVHCVVTQNVDRIHHKAGNHKVIELHGTAFKVHCLSCKNMVTRHSFQRRLIDLNPHFAINPGEMRPDGDVDLTQDQVENFVIPSCESCGGVMKPYIVFFGDNVPKTRVEEVRENVNNSDGILVLGSSLYVYSGYRFILQAVENDIPIAMINIGETRADKHLTLKVEARCGEVLKNILI
ncbi:unnamed protein product [Meganyctiphanes norvegica]|uniref:NAD-dependent protein deacylase n=1 Tax=Meganyctiphanes norvegica TaxID=48144 RepID=A0AAV2QV92_MEGNR